MASRYWVGGTAAWDATAGTKWALTSGGAGGQAVPTGSDTAFFDAASGTVTCTKSATTGANGIDCTGFTGTLSITGATPLFGVGLTLSSTMTISGTGAVSFVAASINTPITCAGKTLTFPITINTGVGIGLVLQDNFSSSNTITLTQGGLYLNSFNLNITNASTVTASGTGAKVIDIGSGILNMNNWAMTGSNISIPTYSGSLSLVAGGTASRSFNGGGLTYDGLVAFGTSASGICIITISGSNTIKQTASYKTVAFTLRFTAGTTNTFGDWTITGTAGNVVTLDSTVAGSRFTVAKSGGGVVSGLDYLSIKDSAATPSITWYAGANSTNVSNNTGWIFTAAPSNKSNFFIMF